MTEKDQKNAETPTQNPEKEEVKEKIEIDDPAGQSKKTVDKAEKKSSEKSKDAASLRAKIAALEKEKTGLQAELSAEKDKYLRMMAEYDNFRRRSAKERDGIYTDAVADVLKDILPMIDNLERAAASGGSDESVRQGLEITLNATKEMLGKLGVERFGEKGDTFDPQIHNAVMHEEDPEAGENVISDVFMAGYRRGDKVLRYAMVKVLN